MLTYNNGKWSPSLNSTFTLICYLVGGDYCNVFCFCILIIHITVFYKEKRLEVRETRKNASNGSHGIIQVS